ncbi:MAG: S49 family peptidase [Desulfobacterales bacterium]|nr:S49 family peptidase [Desulfobacterales bacterium]
MDFLKTQLLSQFVNTPLLLNPADAGAFAAQIAEMSEVDAIRVNIEDGKPYQTIGAVAVINISGCLINKAGGYYSYWTGYNIISDQIKAAIDDNSIAGIFLDIDSPGGSVSGCFDLADEIYEARKVKPIVASCSEHAYSAAYALASQASKIYVPRTGGVGSVGVVCIHTDHSKMLEEWGLNCTLIHAGKHKVDGNPYQPLSDDVKKDFKQELEDVRQLFADTVARGREMPVDEVLATEAKCYNSREALKVGFADAVASPGFALKEFLETVSDCSDNHLSIVGQNMENLTMSKHENVAKASDKNDDEEKKDEEENQPEKGKDEEEKEENSASSSDGERAAVSSERERVAAILNCDAAEGKSELAKSIALDTDLNIEAAVKLLEKAPVEGGSLGLSAAMGAVDNVDVGGSLEGSEDASESSSMVANYRKAKGCA